MEKKSPHILIILDGLGINESDYFNAVHHANTPHLKYLQATYSLTTLHASGAWVGLPNAFQGNSEVGHCAIGTGQVIQQPITLFNKSLLEYEHYPEHHILPLKIKKLKVSNTVHILGLVSDGGVHSHINQIIKTINAVKQETTASIAIHAFLDGRDTPPQSALTYLDSLKKTVVDKQCKIASIHGRWFAMDRNNNWERIKRSYDILTQEATIKSDYYSYITSCYESNIYDEFIPPQATLDHQPIKDGDIVISCNFRADRMRQLTKAFNEKNFQGFYKKNISLSSFISPIPYEKNSNNDYLQDLSQTNNSLLKTLAAHNKTIFSIAETEKYAHITYFFNGGNETKQETEVRCLIPSVQATTYDQAPHMSAKQITKTVAEQIKNNKYDFYLINFANADMVGHSGNFEATKKAVEFLDEQLKEIYKIAMKHSATMYITADHGNAEVMKNKKTQTACTSHTTNKVPFYFIHKTKKEDLSHMKGLSDIASFILYQMNLPISEEMVRTDLYKKPYEHIFHHPQST